MAVLSAMETVTAKVPSTIEAAALCKMAERGLYRSPFSMARLRWTTRSARRRLRSRRSCLPSLDAPTFSSFRTSRRATCSQRACRSWPGRTPPELCLARVPIILTSRADSLESASPRARSPSWSRRRGAKPRLLRSVDRAERCGSDGRLIKEMTAVGGFRLGTRPRCRDPTRPMSYS